MDFAAGLLVFEGMKVKPVLGFLKYGAANRT